MYMHLLRHSDDNKKLFIQSTLQTNSIGFKVKKTLFFFYLASQRKKNLKTRKSNVRSRAHKHCLKKPYIEYRSGRPKRYESKFERRASTSCHQTVNCRKKSTEILEIRYKKADLYVLFSIHLLEKTSR